MASDPDSIDWSKYSTFDAENSATNWGYDAYSNDPLFSEFINSGDSPGQFLPDQTVRNDSTATMYRRDTVVPEQSFLAKSAQTSSRHSPTSSASSTQVKHETPETDATETNLMSPIFHSALVDGTSPMSFNATPVDAFGDLDSKDIINMKSDYVDTSDEFGTSSAIWNPTPAVAQPMRSAAVAPSTSDSNSFDALTRTPLATTFQTTPSAHTFDFGTTGDSPLTITTPPDGQPSVFQFQSGTNSPTEMLASQQHSPNTLFSGPDIPKYKHRTFSNDLESLPSPDIGFKQEDIDNLPYELHVDLQDTKRRVETQVGVTLTLTKVPENATKVHLQPETIPKLKKITKTYERQPDTLELFTSVVCDSAMKKPELLDRARRRAAGLFVPTPRIAASDSEAEVDPDSPLNGGEVKICANCIDRERKRAGRQKIKKAEEDVHFDEHAEKRIIVFNPKEGDTLLLHPPAGNNDSSIGIDTETSKQILIPMRICCYCRHHNETEGFLVIFTLKDHQDQLVAQGVSTTLMITDDHKTPDEKKASATTTKVVASDSQPYGASQQILQQQSMPTSKSASPPFVSHTPTSSIPQSGFEPTLSSTNLAQQAFGPVPLYTPSTTPKLQTTFPIELQQQNFTNQQSAFQSMSANTFSNGFGRGAHRPWASTSNLQALSGSGGEANGFSSLYDTQANFMPQSQSTSVTPRNLSRPASPTFGQSTMKRRKNRPDLTMTPANPPMPSLSPQSPQAISPPVGMLVHHMYTAFHLVDPNSPGGYAPQGQVLDSRNVPMQYNMPPQYVAQDGRTTFGPPGDMVDFSNMQFNPPNQ